MKSPVTVTALLVLCTLALVACGGDLAVAANGRDGGSSSGTPGSSGDLDSGAFEEESDGAGLQFGGSSGGQGQGGGTDSSGGNASSTVMGGGPVDAGYYYGNGSFWVEGGAYPQQLLDAGSEAGTNASVVDASPGCAPLASCCATLTGGSQSLCESVAVTGDGTDCATELNQLQSGGNCTGVAVLASQVQVPPNLLVSDGTLLFWTTTATPALLAMPVGGGNITVLLSGPITNAIGGDAPPPFLAVDDVNVYVLESEELVRIPKNGGAATLVNESGVQVFAATTLGSTAYWLEASPTNPQFALKSAALLGGPISSLATFNYSLPDIDKMAVTSSTVFVGFANSLLGFSLSTGAAVQALPTGTADLSFVSSDTDAVYWAQAAASNLRVGSDGTTMTLGPAASTMKMVSDDNFVYWVDNTAVGTVMKAPKAGGGGATVLARDTSPTAIAVDANSAYWGDADGYIKSIPK
jgi:hypothetical protein